MSEFASLRCNLDRLKKDLDTLAEIGWVEGQGIYRMAYSPADMQARAWLRERLDQAGIAHDMDVVGNVRGHLPGEETAVVMTGSQLDSIPGAGHLHGALGVVCGLEAMRVLREAGIALRHPLELIAFGDEEGRFGGMVGAEALCGKLTAERIRGAEDVDGLKLTEALAAHGLDATEAVSVGREPGSIKAFVELHVEQGPILDKRGLSIGLVDAISGLFKWQVRLLGSSDHAGTTPMDLRRDAFQGLVEFGGQINRVLTEHGSSRSRTNIGRVELAPGSANVVPGEVEFLFEVRDTDPRVLEHLSGALRRTLSAIARRRGLEFEFEVISEIAPVRCDPQIVELIADVACAMDIDSLRMPSGAAHNAQIMASIAPSAMIFVPSKGGRSHSPGEWTDWSDIEKGANTLLQTLIRLAM